MKAAVFCGPEKGVRIEDIPTPKPGPGEVLVRVAGCGVCHTDLHYIDHGVPTFKKPPLILGHEASGTVEGAGKGARVLIPPVLSCETCERCREGRQNICRSMKMVGNHVDGAFAEFIVVPERQLVPLPESLPLVESCILSDAFSTPFHAVVDRARVRKGETVVVVGCGGVGINVVQFAVACGAEVLAVDIQPAKLDLAASLGARTYGAESAIAQIKKAHPEGIDVAFECIGKPESIQMAQRFLRPGGRLCVVGYCERPVELPVAKLMFFEQDWIGSLGCPPSRIAEMIEWVVSGRVRLEPVVSWTTGLEDLPSAFERLRRGTGYRTVIRFT